VAEISQSEVGGVSTRHGGGEKVSRSVVEGASTRWGRRVSEPISCRGASTRWGWSE